MLRIFTVLAAVLGGSAYAQVPDDAARIELLPGWRADDGVHVAGLRIRLAPGWKTYWRAPGDGGIPPLFNWSGSSNLSDAHVHFPVPEVFYQNGLRSIGYENEVILPLVLRAQAPDAEINLNAEVEIGVCEEVCVPMGFRLQVDLPPTGRASGALASAYEDKPATAGPMECTISPISDGLRIEATTRLPPMGSDEAVVLEAGTSGVWVSTPSIARDGGEITVVAEMVPPNAKPFALARDGVRLTLLGNGGAVEILGCS